MANNAIQQVWDDGRIGRAITGAGYFQADEERIEVIMRAMRDEYEEKLNFQYRRAEDLRSQIEQLQRELRILRRLHGTA